ncbi:zf-HC2 domain-containing protein [bacterium]|nr:zf-HC2 domain-containing protein [bacterium]
MTHLHDENIQYWLDGSIESADRTRMRDHLRVCADCRENFETYRRLYMLLKTDDPVSVPAHFADRVMLHLPETGPERIRPFLFRAGWFASALAAGIVIKQYTAWEAILRNGFGWTSALERIPGSMMPYLSDFAIANQGMLNWLLTGTGILVVIMCIDKWLSTRLHLHARKY